MTRLLPVLFFLFLTSLCAQAQQFKSDDGDAAIHDQLTTPLIADPYQLGDLSAIPAGDEIEGDFIGEMQFTPDGEQLWVLHRVTNNISVFDWETKTIIQNIEVGAMPIGIGFSNSYAVVPCYSDNMVYIIDRSDYSVAAQLPTANQPAKVVVSRDGSMAAVGCDEPDVAEIFDLNTLEKVATIQDFPIYLYTFSFITSNTRNSIYFSNFIITPDNGYLVNGAGEEALHFYNIATGEKEVSLPEAADCGQISLSGDGEKIVAVRNGNQAIAFQVDVPTQSLSTQVALTDVSVYSHYCAPAVNMDGGKMLVSAGGDHDVVLVDFSNDSFMSIATGNTPDWVGQSADYQYAIAADYYMAVIDFDSGDILSDLNGISIQNAAISPVNNHLAATDPLRYESLNFYDFEDPADLHWAGEASTGSELEADATYSVAFTPDLSKLIAVNSLSGTLSIVDVATESLDHIVPLGSTETFHVDITSDSRYALVAKRLENSVAIVDLLTGELVADVSSGGSKPDQVFVLPGDDYAYAVNAGSSDRIGVIALDGANSTLQSTFVIGNTGVSWTNYGLRCNLVIHPSGDYALIANPFDDAVQIIDLTTHSVVETIPVSGFPLQLAIGQDDDFGAFVGVTLKNQSAIALLAVPGNNGSLVDVYPGGGNPTRIAYDPAARQFGVTANDDHSLRSFDPGTLAYTGQETYDDHTPVSVAYSENGRRFLLLRSNDVDVAPHQLEVDGTVYDLPSLPMHNMAISPDGTLAAVPMIASDEVVLFREGPLGIRSERIGLQRQIFKIFPNPAASYIRLKRVEHDDFPVRASLQLFSPDGTLLLEQEVLPETPDLTIDRSAQWPSGVYFVEIYANGSLSQRSKIVFK